MTLAEFFAARYPPESAYDWDNVGLQIGTLNKPITGVLVALDVTKDVIDEALACNANVIVSHHPLIFKPLRNITTDAYKGQVIERLMKHDIALYVAHTNYDIGDAGMNAVLADTIGLQDATVLDRVDETRGIGRIGRIDAMPLNDAIDTIKARLNLRYARLISATRHITVRTVALSGGSGTDFMTEAKRQRADLYLTGDVTYHHAHDALQMGLAVLDIGHATEKFFAAALANELNEAGMAAPVHASRVDPDPFETV